MSGMNERLEFAREHLDERSRLEYEVRELRAEVMRLLARIPDPDDLRHAISLFEEEWQFWSEDAAYDPWRTELTAAAARLRATLEAEE